MQRYNPKEIEPKWQKHWLDNKTYKADDNSTKPKYYALSFFPYPSGIGLHIGHTRNFTITDVMARYKRMTGHEVLHPMGWDSFGLPAENYAVKTGIPPQVVTKQNEQNFHRQCDMLGMSFDWDREFSSTDPEFYKWTQWFFLLLHKRDLAYRKESAQFWCNSCKTVLANEQVVNGCCWRHEELPVTKKTLPQWFFKITDYAERLVADLDGLDWPAGIKAMQKNWIGKKTGINISYQIDNVDSAEDENVICFTTRPDTNYGATFVVVAPEHPLAARVASGELAPNDGPLMQLEVAEYIEKSMSKTEIERQEEGRKKTGAFTGLYAHNPLNGKRLPIWVSDFVLMGFGTGAVVGVPGHDMRDFEFANCFDIPVERVVVGDNGDDTPIKSAEQVQEDNGVMVNSEFLNGMNIHDATIAMMDHMQERGMGTKLVNYKIRDWLISRQRYWGAPIPIIHCNDCGAVPVREDQLPVVLPDMQDFQPTGDGRSPLAKVREWVEALCPSCGKMGQRETDTMDGFACSSWYFLRFADPSNSDQPFSKQMADRWAPVDMYVGGAEHAVMHLLYARMWTKVMQDEGLINFGEPFIALKNQGMLLAADGQKISKSKGNDIKPEEIINQGYGADALRMITLFLAPYNQSTPWSNDGLGGIYRFLQRSWNLVQDFLDDTSAADEAASSRLQIAKNVALKRVTDDLDDMGYNTAISAMMEYVNELYRIKATDGFAAKIAWRGALESLVQMIAPFGPYITEELWQQLGHQTSVHHSDWPKYDASLLVKDEITIVVQVNGKVRANMLMPKDSTEDQVVDAAKSNERVMLYLTSEPKKIIYIPGKLVSIVV